MDINGTSGERSGALMLFENTAPGGEEIMVYGTLGESDGSFGISAEDRLNYLGGLIAENM